MKKPVTILIALLTIAVLVSCRFVPDINFDLNNSPTSAATPRPQVTNAPPVIVDVEDIANTDLILTNLYE